MNSYLGDDKISENQVIHGKGYAPHDGPHMFNGDRYCHYCNINIENACVELEAKLFGADSE